MKKLTRVILDRLRFKKLKNRILVSLIALSVPPIFIVGIISYNITSNALVENYIKSYNQQLKTFDEGVDYVFNNVIKMSRYILSNNNLRRQLIDQQLDRNDPLTSFQLQKIISEYLVENKHVDSLCLVDTKFEAICNGRSDNIGIYEGQNKTQKIKSASWYKQMIEQRGKETFFNYNVLDPSNSSTFSMVKWLLNPEEMKLEPMGFLVVNMNKSIFSEDDHQGSESGLVVADTAEEEIEILYATDPHLQAMFSGEKSSTANQSIQKTGYISSNYKNKTTGWTFIHMIKEDMLLEELYKIRNITFFIATIIAFAAILLSIFLSQTITTPLEKLKKMMISWSKGKTKFTEEFYNDEVGRIGETFKTLAVENNELSVRLARSQLKEREAELRVLQAQINPHFLYNALDSIYWMAVMNNQQDIGKMAISLSESFKIILSKGKEIISISEELRHIDYYMTIQNIRHGGRFRFIQNIDPSIMDVGILKLLLQPLIENAIYHGLEKKIGEGIVSIVGKRIKEMIVFEIQDNGIGIEDMEIINEGYGLGNIRERLDLYYGSSSFFEISSKINDGTKVRIGFDPSVAGRSIKDESANC